MKIKWKNKYSGETGYVKCLHRRGRYFENTFDIEQARIFSVRLVDKAIADLENYCPDNIYKAIPA